MQSPQLLSETLPSQGPGEGSNIIGDIGGFIPINKPVPNVLALIKEVNFLALKSKTLHQNQEVEKQNPGINQGAYNNVVNLN